MKSYYTFSSSRYWHPFTMKGRIKFANCIEPRPALPPLPLLVHLEIHLTRRALTEYSRLSTNVIDRSHFIAVYNRTMNATFQNSYILYIKRKYDAVKYIEKNKNKENQWSSKIWAHPYSKFCTVLIRKVFVTGEH